VISIKIRWRPGFIIQFCTSFI